MAEKQAKEDLHNLVMDKQFQAQVTERAFQFIIHEDIPHYWKLQLDLLLAIKFVFDRVRPREATVIFPNLPLRHPRGDAEILLQLAGIQSVHEGLQMWIEHLASKGSVQLDGSDWQTAFRQTPHGYRIDRMQAEDDSHYSTTNLPETLLKLSVNEQKQKASDEMTETIETIFNRCQLIQDVSYEALKDTIIQKARDLLPRYMEPVPLDFAINNYNNLIKTAYGAGSRLGSGNVACQAIIDAKEALASGFGSKVRIVIVNGAIPQGHASTLLKTKTDIHRLFDDSWKEKRLGSYGVCFAGLPGTGSGDVWRKLRDSNSEMRFCEYVELPIDSASHVVNGRFLRRLLLSTVT